MVPTDPDTTLRRLRLLMAQKRDPWYVELLPWLFRLSF